MSSTQHAPHPNEAAPNRWLQEKQRIRDDMNRGEDQSIARELQFEEITNNVARLAQESPSSSDHDNCCEDDESFARRLEEEERVRVGEDESTAALARKLQDEEIRKREEEYKSSVEGKKGQKCGGKKLKADADSQLAKDELYAQRILHEELSTLYEIMSRSEKKTGGVTGRGVSVQANLPGGVSVETETVTGRSVGAQTTLPGAVSVESPFCETSNPATASYQAPTIIEQVVEIEEETDADSTEGATTFQITGSDLNMDSATQDMDNVVVEVASSASSLKLSLHSDVEEEEEPPLLEAWVAPVPVLAEVAPIPDIPNRDKPPSRPSRFTTLIIIFLILAVAAFAAIFAFFVMREDGESANDSNVTTIVNHTTTTMVWTTEELTIIIQLDDKPEEVGWTLDCGTGPENVLRVDVGFYEGRENELVSQTEHVLYGGECNFTIYDTGKDGIKKGYFKIFTGDDITDEGAFLVEGSGWTDTTTLTFRLRPLERVLSPLIFPLEVVTSLCPRNDVNF